MTLLFSLIYALISSGIAASRRFHAKIAQRPSEAIDRLRLVQMQKAASPACVRQGGLLTALLRSTQSS